MTSHTLAVFPNHVIVTTVELSNIFNRTELYKNEKLTGQKSFLQKILYFPINVIFSHIIVIFYSIINRVFTTIYQHLDKMDER